MNLLEYFRQSLATLAHDRWAKLYSVRRLLHFEIPNESCFAFDHTVAGQEPKLYLVHISIEEVPWGSY